MTRNNLLSCLVCHDSRPWPWQSFPGAVNMVVALSNCPNNRWPFSRSSASWRSATTYILRMVLEGGEMTASCLSALILHQATIVTWQWGPCRLSEQTACPVASYLEKDTLKINPIKHTYVPSVGLCWNSRGAVPARIHTVQLQHVRHLHVPIVHLWQLSSAGILETRTSHNHPSCLATAHCWMLSCFY